MTVGERHSAIDTSKMSEGKAAALEVAESAREEFVRRSFAAPLFMGRFDWSQIHPFPEQTAEERAAGDAFLAKLDVALREHSDPDEVDRVGEIPDELVEALREIGAFGVKIPEKYGGLGMSQVNYTRFGIVVGSHCASTMALLSAHQSIGVPTPLMHFGTDEQKQRFLPGLARGELSAFALTESGVGSDPARMATTARLTEDGKHYVIDGEKLWCTNGTCAKHVVVMANTKPDQPAGKRARPEISAFIVPGDAPGVTVEHRCDFMGLKALYNAVMRFEDVKIPRENLIAAEGRGLKVALTTLNTGRLMLPAGCIGMAKKALTIVRRWAAEREQWGAPIGKHGAVADRIASMAATIFAMESMTLLTSKLVDLKDRDIRIEAGMCKMWCTERSWELINDAMQVKGGRGYETAKSLADRGDAPDPIERFMRDTRITTLFEGSSEILRLFISREAMDPHLRAAGDALDTRLPGGKRLSGALRAAGFYAGWYPKVWLPGGASTDRMDPVLARHVGYAARTSKKLARRLFHAMARHGTKLEREQMLLGRFVDVGTELFVIAATCSRAQSLLRSGDAAEGVRELADLACSGARLRIDRAFSGLSDNVDRPGYRLAQGVLEGRYEWLERGVVGDL